MLGYRYDGTWDGLLTLLARVRADGTRPDRVSRGEPPQSGLFDRMVEVATDPEAAEAFLAMVRQQLGPTVARHTYLAYLSEATEAALLVRR